MNLFLLQQNKWLILYASIVISESADLVTQLSIEMTDVELRHEIEALGGTEVNLFYNPAQCETKFFMVKIFFVGGFRIGKISNRSTRRRRMD